MDDKELLSRCLHGDSIAWDILREMILNLASALFSTSTNLSLIDLDDIVQETLTALLTNDCRSLRSFRGESSLTTYLAAITRRVGWGWLGRHRGEIPLSHDNGQLCERNQWLEMWPIIEKTLSSSEILLLRLGSEGYQAGEIAEILSRIEGYPLTADAVRQRRHRAIRRIHRALMDEK